MNPLEGPLGSSLTPASEECADNAQTMVKDADSAGEMHTLLQRPLPHESRAGGGIGMGAGATAAIAGVRIGTIMQVGEAGLLVLLAGEHEPLAAQALCPLSAEDAGRPCAVLFVDGDVRKPLVVGCVLGGVPADVADGVRADVADGIPADVADGVPDAYNDHPHAAPAQEFLEHTAFADKREVVVDGEVVRIEATRELELRCGESVILLQSNGRIEIRGNYVTSQATATQRLRGGSVHIN